MVTCAASRRWTLLDHGVVTEWVRNFVSSEHVSLVLDPVLNAAGSGAIQIGVSRILSKEGWLVRADLSLNIQQRVAGRSLVLIDDVAASGQTLLRVAAVLQGAGASIKAFVVAAASETARSRLQDVHGSGCVTTFLPGDSHAIHLRDFCPGLPRVGRLAAGVPPVIVGDRAVEVRLPPAVLTGGLWESVFQDRNLRRLQAETRKQLILRFTQALGRPPLVSDLPLLGEDVQVPLCTDVLPSAESPLEMLLFSSSPDKAGAVREGSVQAAAM
jgi:hypothetical protein